MVPRSYISVLMTEAARAAWGRQREIILTLGLKESGVNHYTGKTGRAHKLRVPKELPQKPLKPERVPDTGRPGPCALLAPEEWGWGVLVEVQCWEECGRGSLWKEGEGRCGVELGSLCRE